MGILANLVSTLVETARTAKIPRRVWVEIPVVFVLDGRNERIVGSSGLRSLPSLKLLARTPNNMQRNARGYGNGCNMVAQQCCELLLPTVSGSSTCTGPYNQVLLRFVFGEVILFSYKHK